MSVLDYCGKLALFTDYQLDVVKMLIKQYIDTNTQMFGYLKEVNLQKVQIFWYADSNQDVLGGFHLFSYSIKNGKYAIYINDFFSQNGNIRRNHSVGEISMVLQTILHELKHFWQKEKMGWLLYFVLQFPIIRQFTIQKSARQISKCVADMNIGGNLTTTRQFILKCKYNLNNLYLTNEQLNLKDYLVIKKVDWDQLYNNKRLITLKSIKQFVEKNC